MKLTVIRHAIAEDATPGQADSARELTRDGRKRLRAVVKGLRAMDVSFDRVLTSPYARARATAAALKKLADAAPEVTPLLAESPKAALLGLLAARGESIAIVGHQPWLGELVGWLAFGDTRHGDAFELKKAGVVLLDGSTVPGGMTIRALLTPSLLRDLA
ncbi:MAG TPA: phosphohistidine phosphatase SixA [Kofleriaceae bacterium]|jgi:phosphohistidine phosphatase